MAVTSVCRPWAWKSQKGAQEWWISLGYHLGMITIIWDVYIILYYIILYYITLHYIIYYIILYYIILYYVILYIIYIYIYVYIYYNIYIYNIHNIIYIYIYYHLYIYIFIYIWTWNHLILWLCQFCSGAIQLAQCQVDTVEPKMDGSSYQYRRCSTVWIN